MTEVTRILLSTGISETETLPAAADSRIAEAVAAGRGPAPGLPGWHLAFIDIMEQNHEASRPRPVGHCCHRGPIEQWRSRCAAIATSHQSRGSTGVSNETLRTPRRWTAMAAPYCQIMAAAHSSSRSHAASGSPP